MPLLTIPQPDTLQTCAPSIGWREPDPISSKTPLGCQRRQPLQKRKTVRFALKETIHLIPTRAEMSPSLWMDDFTKKENKQEVSNTVFLIRSGLGNKLQEEDFFCPRGLEHLVDKQRKKQQVQRSIAVALSMQQVLREKGEVRPSLIAMAYKRFTQHSKERAYKLAIRDYAESIRKRRRPRKLIRLLSKRS